MERPLRLNLGSGRHPWPNAINIDHDDRADIIGSVVNLDFEDDSVDEIYAIHLFEHFHRTKEAPQALREWRRVLKPGGKLVLEMPCLDKIAEMIVGGEEKPGLTTLGIFGDIREESPYMRHQWCYTRNEISRLLEAEGFNAEIQEPVFHHKKRDMRAIGATNEQSSVR